MNYKQTIDLNQLEAHLKSQVIECFHLWEVLIWTWEHILETNLCTYSLFQKKEKKTNNNNFYVHLFKSFTPSIGIT